MKDQIKASLLDRKRSEAEEVFIASLRDRLQKEGQHHRRPEESASAGQLPSE